VVHSVFRSIGCLLFCVSVCGRIAAEDLSPPITIYTSNMSPSIIRKVEGVGAARQLVDMLLVQADLTAKYQILPWKRALVVSARSPNGFVFPVARTRSREPLYDWTLPLFRSTIHLLTTDDRKASIANIDDMVVGVLADSAQEDWLQEYGHTSIFVVNGADDQALRLLRRGRFHAWLTERSIAEATVRVAGAGDEITISDPLWSYDIHLVTAVDKATPYMHRLRSALHAVRDDARYRSVLSQYGYTPVVQ